MKRIIIIITALILCSTLSAQPQKMSYQAVVRKADNSLAANATIGMRISILQGSATGTAVYVETQTSSSNDNGLVTLEIGGGNVQSGDFSTIDWANGPYFIKTETDPNGGTNYSISGTSQLLSVPYALYAEASGTPGPAGVDGVGVVSTIDNGDGTFTINYSDNTSFTSGDLTGPQGPTGNTSAANTPYNNTSSNIPNNPGNVQDAIDENDARLDALENFVVARAEGINNQNTTIPHNQVTLATFPNENFDTHNAYNPTAGVFICPVAGYYEVKSRVVFDTQTWSIGAQPHVQYRVNGTTVAQLDNDSRDAGQTARVFLSGSDIVYLNQGDQLSIHVFQTTGANSTLMGGSTHMSVHLIGK
ncbi:MAG: hypothetical protein WD048_02395 [Chitinophagales bacterium]